MKEDPDMGTQSGEERIDELLNGYIDDELAIRQRTEVERLIAHDTRIERRLQQLQKCRTLLGSLPCAEAPPQILQEIKATLAVSAPLYQESSYGKRAGRIHLLARKMLSAAAMLGLVALLAGVIYTILAPQAALDQPPVLADRPPSENIEAVIPAPAGSPTLAFSGRLELKTSVPAEVGAIINTAIEENGLSDSIGDIRESNKRIHYLRCSREGLDLLLASLENVWSRLDSATMVIDTAVFDRPVAVDSVTTEQISQIIDQDNYQERIELAKDFNLLNTMAANMPGAEVLSAVEGQITGVMIIPKPLIVGPTTPRVPDETEADKTIRLTIILSR